jgi:fructose-specific phosphotransferase system IIA component
MEIADLFHPSCIAVPLDSDSKWGAISDLAGILHRNQRIDSVDGFLNAVRERESQVSTGVGFGIAIPHGISDCVRVPSIAVGRLARGIDFDAIDGQPVDLVFLLAIPANYGDRLYLRTLSHLARLLAHPEFRQELLAAGSAGELLDVVARRAHAQAEKNNGDLADR